MVVECSRTQGYFKIITTNDFILTIIIYKIIILFGDMHNFYNYVPECHIFTVQSGMSKQLKIAYPITFT